MCSWWLIYLLVPVFIGVLVTEYKSDIFRLMKLAFVTDIPADQLDILVYIPSARSNFDQRTAIRDTWMKNTIGNDTVQSRVSVQFTIGRQFCRFPPEDRLSVYSCEEWDVGLPENNAEILAVDELTLDKHSMKGKRVYGNRHLPFTVQHPVVITKLGIYKDSIGTKAEVKLVEASTQKEIVRAVFLNTKDSKVQTVNNFVYKNITPYFLPKGFVGIVVGESLSSGNGDLPFDRLNTSQASARNNGSGILQFTHHDSLPDGHYYDIRRWKSRGVDIVSFSFVIEELDSLKRHITERPNRLSKWVANCSEEDQLLTSESSEYRDITFVDVVDVYRNVPYKFLQFARWSVEQQQIFNFLLKTDDDCFVDIERLLTRIQKLGNVEKSWLGRFRHNWMVDKHGKWAEPDYPAVVYPKFACGSGYLLTRDLVEWLANNSDTLKAYQGEDVSMGIWLAAVGPHYIDEPLWQCEKECLSNMYVEPELHPDELRQIWNDRQTCGDPCGCR